MPSLKEKSPDSRELSSLLDPDVLPPIPLAHTVCLNWERISKGQKVLHVANLAQAHFSAVKCTRSATIHLIGANHASVSFSHTTVTESDCQSSAEPVLCASDFERHALGLRNTWDVWTLHMLQKTSTHASDTLIDGLLSLSLAMLVQDSEKTHLHQNDTFLHFSVFLTL